MSEPRGWTARHPELGTGTVPVSPYVSREWFERERERVFRRAWLNVCREEDLPACGDYLVKNLAGCGASILLVRGRDEGLRAFHNVCSHRGSRIARGSGNAPSRFVCRFHGWTYDVEGRLESVPDEAQFAEFDKSTGGLAPVGLETWQGFVFVNLDPSPAGSLSEYLGEIGERLAGYPFASMVRLGEYAAEVAANWKYVLDIFQECYHVPTVHNRTVADAGTGEANPLSHLVWAHCDRLHRSASVYMNPAHQPTAAEALAFRYGASIVQA
ncbi:MAG: aromatic ring-hydroxylating oxygenase subunit alpha, partial [Candidatus Binatia bacterium]